MIESSFYKEVMRLLLSSSMEESLFQTLQYLEFSTQASGFALLIRQTEATHAMLLGTSQLQNIQGLPIGLPFPEESGLFTLDDATTIEELATAMELDIFCENPVLYGYMGSLPMQSDIVLLMFAERTPIEIDLEIVGQLFQLVLRDTHFLTQLRERTNPSVGRKENRILSIIKGNRELFENSTDGILILDHRFNVVFINRILENLLGYAIESVVNRSVFDLISPQDAEIFQENILEPDSPFEVESITLSRESVILRIDRTRMLAEHGLIVLRCWDVTETRRVQTQLSYTSDFLSQLVRNSSIAIVAGEMGKTLFLFSPAAEKLFGYDAGSVIGNLRFQDLFTDASTWETIEKMLTSQDGNLTNRVDQLSVDVKVAGNMEAPVVLSAFLVPQYQPGRDAVVAYFTDLRDKKAMEAAIIEYQKKLEDTEKQAMLSNLAGAMAHELNQPLMSILGYAELLQKPHLPPEKLERGIRTIAREAERMSEIVKKIGNITHFETRNYVGNATIFDIEKGSSHPESK